jgi:hypothetical protein
MHELTETEIMVKIQNSPIYFVEIMWGMLPQPLRPEKEIVMKIGLTLKGEQWNQFARSIRGDWFKPFIKGKHITWQQYVILLCIEKAIRHEAEHKISVVSGHGCHAKNTEIMMIDGTVRAVQDIIIGDVLMGDDSKPRRVLSLARGSEQMYRIRYHDGSFYDVNENHILSLVASQSHGKQKLGDITNVTVKDYLSWSNRKQRTNIGHKASVEFPHKKQDIESYLLGLWLGDGTSTKGEITNPDREIIEYLRILGAKNVSKDNRCPIWRIPEFVSSLRSAGLLENKHIPNNYLTGDTHQRLELLAGLLDSDGYLSKSGFEIVQKRKALAHQIAYLARSVGCHATIKEVEKTCTNAKDGPKKGKYWLVYITRNIWNIPTRVARKQAKRPNKPQRETLNFGFAVEKLKVADFYGFELDGNNLFLLGDFTVTHNTGKTAAESWILLWYLYCHSFAQVPCTAPTSSQMFDILWKEAKLWIDRLPEDIAVQFEWTSDHIRMTEAPQTWFARAKTASKESPEALAGVHGEWVCMLVDEGSGVEDIIYNTAAGALTNENVLFLVISNGTRSIGYFFDSHHEGKHNFQYLSFDSNESPIVDPRFVTEITEKFGKDSDEYRIRVQGKFPKESSMDDKGYVQLYTEAELHEYEQMEENEYLFKGGRIMGLDPSGEGRDKTVWGVRDRLKYKTIAEESISSAKSIAAKTITLADKFGIRDDQFHDIVEDSFGVGAEVGMEIAVMTQGKGHITQVNTGEACDLESDRELFLNKRAEAYWKSKLWFRSGGSVVMTPKLKQQLLSIRYRRNMQGKIQIEPKQDMKKRGVASPDEADTFSMTFLRDISMQTIEEVNRIRQMSEQFDANSIFGE